MTSFVEILEMVMYLNLENIYAESNKITGRWSVSIQYSLKRKKIDEVKGSQHNQTGNKDESNKSKDSQHLGDRVNEHPCFKCYYFKPDCHDTKNRKLTRKLDRSAVNTQEIMDQKFKELKEAKKSIRRNGKSSDFQHIGEVEIIQDPHETDKISDLPKFDYSLLEDPSNDCNLDWEQLLAQQVAINPRMVVNLLRKEISFEL